MLDADESAIFDEAMRHDPLLRDAYLDVDRLSAAIAVASTTPVPPRAGQLERIQSRLGLNAARKIHLWLAVSGWAAAAVLALMLVIAKSPDFTGKASPHTAATPPAAAAPVSSTPAAMIRPAADSPSAVTGEPRPDSETPSPSPAPPPAAEADAKQIAKVETRRLIQEIEVLRENLQKFQERDRVLFQAVPGMALPVIMRMKPPGTADVEDDLIAAADEPQSPVHFLLAEAARSANPPSSSDVIASGTAGPDSGITEPTTPDAIVTNPPALTEPPSAIPIYDAARDAGTLVVSNLPPAAEGRVYNLWVKTAHSEQPVFVGSLPNAGALRSESFDFSLGSNMVLPSGFVLTQDPLKTPTPPDVSNTVLQGPPVPGR